MYHFIFKYIYIYYITLKQNICERKGFCGKSKPAVSLCLQAAPSPAHHRPCLLLPPLLLPEGMPAVQGTLHWSTVCPAVLGESRAFCRDGERNWGASCEEHRVLQVCGVLCRRLNWARAPRMLSGVGGWVGVVAQCRAGADQQS